MGTAKHERFGAREHGDLKRRRAAEHTVEEIGVTEHASAGIEDSLTDGAA